jgi:prolyl-tRNA synthetase
VRPAHPAEIEPLMGAKPGSLGAVQFKGAPVFVDRALEGRVSMVTGANRDGFHLKNVDVQRDILAHGGQLVELRSVKAGEGCPKCDGVLDVFKAVEVGHIFKLGTKYSEAMGARVHLADGSEVPVVMGSYGIGVERVMAAAVELHHDADGILWPMSIAPYQVIVVTAGKEPELLAAGEKVAQAMSEAGIEVLFDDRDERPGVKFKDADLLGIPLRIAVGKRGLAEGKVEWKPRDQKSMELLALDEVADKAVEFVKSRGGRLQG